MKKKSHRALVGMTGLLIVLASFTFNSGGLGLLLGGLVVGSWWVLPAMYAFVLGQFALLLVATPQDGLAAVAGAELGLLGLLCTSTAGPPRPGRVEAISACAAGGATLLGWLSAHRLAPLWGVGGLVLGGGAILAYWLHRYERVALEPPADTETATHE